MSQTTKRILYVTATLPALTVTFIYKEIFRLRGMGVMVDCVSMNTPRASEVSEESRSLLNETTYLDSISLLSKLASFFLVWFLHPIRMFRCLGIVIAAKPMQGVRDYARLLYHWIEAAHLCRHLDMNDVHHIHAHFVNGPSSIAMFLSEISNVPFSFTMHASMIWLDPIALRNKLDRSAFSVSISQYNANYIAQEYGEKFTPKIQIVHCGIDPEQRPLPLSQMQSDGLVRLLGIGQLNPRKGFHILIDACRILRDNNMDVQCTIVGDGEQRSDLEKLVEMYGLGDRVHFTGSVKHEAVWNLLASCDIFVLPCVISKDGWRDGIPVVLMEAMFQQRTTVSTRMVGIPELIEDGISGRLVEPEDPQDLADTIKELAGSPETCIELARKGREKVLAEFNNASSATELARLFSGTS